MNDPEFDAALDAGKRDGAYLREVLSVPSDHNHALCPRCKKRNMAVGPAKANEGKYYRFHCYTPGCIGAGNVVDALMILDGKSCGAACVEVAKRYGAKTGGGDYRPRRPEPRPEPERQDEGVPIHYGAPHADPVLDLASAEAFVASSHEYLLQHLELVAHWKRGLTEKVIREYRIGFIENVPLKWFPDSDRGWLIPAAWVLPILDEKGRLKAVKLHFEIRPLSRGQPCEGKSRWAPFGTQPPFKREGQQVTTSNHAYFGLWPHPATLHTPLPEVHTDIYWFIQRIPKDSDLERRWFEAMRYYKAQVAVEYRADVERLDNVQLQDATQRAFDDMRDDIMRVALKSEAKTEKKRDEDQPEPVNWSEYLFVLPGELKALAALSMGFMATSITSGESWIPPHDMLRVFEGWKVVVVWDADPPRKDASGHVRRSGAEWGRQIAQAIRRAGATEVLMVQSGDLKNTKPPESSQEL